MTCLMSSTSSLSNLLANDESQMFTDVIFADRLREGEGVHREAGIASCKQPIV